MPCPLCSLPPSHFHDFLIKLTVLPYASRSTLKPAFHSPLPGFLHKEAHTHTLFCNLAFFFLTYSSQRGFQNSSCSVHIVRGVASVRHHCGDVPVYSGPYFRTPRLSPQGFFLHVLRNLQVPGGIRNPQVKGDGCLLVQGQLSFVTERGPRVFKAYFWEKVSRHLSGFRD